ncbi:glycoside hydrolase family 3 C-terminal domain-containing protein [candidate division KSB1 bacterium]|nr:glycoside hydrolase family 3 C-terminal domain-containing protein [candidate division KSB1 bacterium]
MHSTKQNPGYLNPELPIDERVADLISRMTLEEKVGQMLYNAEAIPRLNVPAYNWWSECLHGVARAGRATVFPQAIGLAATFDADLLFRIAVAISDEGRAMFHAAVKKGNRLRYGGLTFWSPNVNIFRDPRWGRGQETYGEDPFLTATLGVAFVKGLQGDHPHYLKTAACAKHYVVHSGPEADRHHFNAKPSLKDMFETYLPAFQALVKAGVESVMCAYNRTNDEACCGSKKLLKTILREKWGFLGHVVSDCWALADFHLHHKITETPAESAALAINSGVNLNCGNTFPYLIEAVKKGLVTEATIDEALSILLKTRFKLGLFDPDELNPYAQIPADVIGCEKHRQLALEAARKSVVLMKNKNNVLPLSRDISYIYVVGPNATSVDVLLGNYYGLNDQMVTFVEGLTGKLNPGSFIQYKQGCLLDRPNANPIDWVTNEIKEADATIAFLGISNLLEGEEGESIASPTKGDRFDIKIPQHQVDFLRKIREDNPKPVIVVLTGGSPMDISELEPLADAILYAWYPGQEGGNAVADILFGEVSPSGRLPVTFPKSIDQLPAYEDYRLDGRTYRFMHEEPMYPFGFGLSYSRFEYNSLKLSQQTITAAQNLIVSVAVTNTGHRPANEVVQLYISDLEASVRVPRFALRGIKCIHLKPGQTEKVEFNITPDMLKMVDEDGASQLEPGKFKIFIGPAAPGKRAVELGLFPPLEAIFELI